MPGRCVIQIISARRLAAKDTNGKSDPWVEMKFENIHRKTPVISESLDPEWNETWEFDCFLPPSIEFTVWDKDVVGNDFLGQVTIPLSRILNGGVIEPRWFPLEKRSKGSHISGHILVGIKYTPESSSGDPFLVIKPDQDLRPLNEDLLKI